MKRKGIREMEIKNAVKSLLTATIVTTTLYMGAFGAFAAGTCKVSADAAKIRETASTSAEVVGSTVKGSKLDVLSSTKDGNGYTWYKVYVDGNTTGYIRADLVSDVKGDISSDSSSNSSSSSNNNDSSSSQSQTVEEVSTTVVEPCEFTKGVTVDTVSVRESASTKSNKKATANAGQELSITGQATGSDSKIWYQISFDGVEGFIRSDLVNTDVASEPEEEITDAEETVSEEVEEPAPISVPNNDYELRYEPNNDGVDTWYLYDHIKGTRQSIDNINAVMQQSQTMQAGDSEDAAKYKKIVIIMGIVILVLVIVVSILLFKLRDSYEDWEDEDEEDPYEEEEPEPVKPVKKTLAKKAPVVKEEELDEDDEDIKIVTKKGKPKKASAITKPSKSLQEDRKEAWQSKNFLDIDDDMEFEFLDIDK